MRLHGRNPPVTPPTQALLLRKKMGVTPSSASWSSLSDLVRHFHLSVLYADPFGILLLGHYFLTEACHSIPCPLADCHGSNHAGQPPISVTRLPGAGPRRTVLQRVCAELFMFPVYYVPVYMRNLGSNRRVRVKKKQEQLYFARFNLHRDRGLAI